MANFDIREVGKRWPRLYYMVANILGPVWWSGLSSQKYLRKYAGSGTLLNLGSGPKILPDTRVLNVDIIPYAGVAIVAPADAVPLPDASVSSIILDNVLEHVPKPDRVIGEISRLLERGGTVYVAVPFLYPFHSSPSDFTRWTLPGLHGLLESDFDILEEGVRCGPFSALTALLSHIGASILCFGSSTLRALLFNVCMLVFLPIKLLDIVGAHLPGAHEIASVVYIVARKKGP
jgi:SAM-dependent methyltransferase